MQGSEQLGVDVRSTGFYRGLCFCFQHGYFFLLLIILSQFHPDVLSYNLLYININISII